MESPRAGEASLRGEGESKKKKNWWNPTVETEVCLREEHKWFAADTLYIIKYDNNRNNNK